MSWQEDEKWVDHQLRKVPLPEGLKERLRLIARADDASLDAEIRAIHVPEGLSDRLKAVVEDEQLDRRLCDVPVPDELAESLRYIVEDERIDRRLREPAAPVELLEQLLAIPEDEQLDRRLRDVPVPVGLQGRLWQIAHGRGSRIRWSQLALAASLLIIIGVSYAASIMGVISTAYRTPEKLERIPIDGGIILRDPGNDSQLVMEPPIDDVDPLHGEASPDRPVAEESFPAEGELLALPQLDWEKIFQNPRVPPEEFFLNRWGKMGAPVGVDDQLPELTFIPTRHSRGLTPPLARGFDRTFLFKYGVHPIVQPAADPALRRCEVPLHVDDETFTLAERLTSQGRLPRPDQVRTEDFLAALDYDLAPAPAGRLALRTAAGPSIFGPQDARLLQVAVQAGSIVSRKYPRTDLTIAVDTSASMATGNRCGQARTALKRLLSDLGPEDRLTLVTFNKQVTTVCDRAGAGQVPALDDEIDRYVTAHGPTNFGEGLRQAAAKTLRDAQSGHVRRLVIISDGAAGLNDEMRQRIGRILSDVAAARIGVTFIDVSLNEADSALAVYATRIAGGRRIRAESAQDMLHVLQEDLCGNSAVVAADAKLSVEFNPKAVAGYRLFGHEASAADGILPEAVPIELRAGETATGLFELWLQPNGADDVATVRLSWTDPQSGVEHRLEQRVSRLQFASSIWEAAPSLQTAALAAESAEALRSSYFVAQPRTAFENILEAADTLSERVVSGRATERLLRLIRQANDIQAGRMVPTTPQ